MIEHRVWCPAGYQQSGIAGQRIAIAGHSHTSDEPDNAAMTENCLKKVISGEYPNLQFFNRVPGYFGCDDRAGFWNSVLFFNFVPSIVGARSEWNNNGTKEQNEAGRARVQRILDKYKPDKLFVFTKKGWDQFPPTLEDQKVRPLVEPLNWHTYQTASGHEVKAIGLPHPDRAKKATQIERVKALMAS
ncbi:MULTISPECIES: hypothetical protein [unclassified Sphingobium]|uniref:hypothetical protein n=1 Tax=unclassified Sphingobium TaxID=2611147 RepID=UPI0007703B4B|nr:MULTISPECIES: hypothetical protein [unclassified Sphingobium]AMK16831.1 hypothetical protein K663_02210 [Sphingobium sp. MI1205]